jgi:hypothetical protein
LKLYSTPRSIASVGCTVPALGERLVAGLGREWVDHREGASTQSNRAVAGVRPATGRVPTRYGLRTRALRIRGMRDAGGDMPGRAMLLARRLQSDSLPARAARETGSGHERSQDRPAGAQLSSPVRAQLLLATTSAAALVARPIHLPTAVKGWLEQAVDVSGKLRTSTMASAYERPFAAFLPSASAALGGSEGTCTRGHGNPELSRRPVQMPPPGRTDCGPGGRGGTIPYHAIPHADTATRAVPGRKPSIAPLQQRGGFPTHPSPAHGTLALHGPSRLFRHERVEAAASSRSDLVQSPCRSLGSRDPARATPPRARVPTPDPPRGARGLVRLATSAGSSAARRSHSLVPAALCLRIRETGDDPRGVG